MNPNGLVTSAATQAASFSGHLHLAAARRDDGRTTITKQSFRAPFHISKPYWDADSGLLQVQVVNPTAGILAGDELDLDVHVHSGAALVVTTPAATRAFMMRQGVGSCRQRLSVDEGGWLEFVPEPLCPHRGTNFAQATEVRLAAGAGLCLVDALAPGRVGRGERWAWQRLVIALDVTFAGETVLRERLEASGPAMDNAAAFHGTPDAWLATMLLVTEQVRADDPGWTRIASLHGGGRWVGVTRLRRGGWIIRMLAPGGQELRDLLREIRSCLAESLPPLRSNLRKL